MRRIVTFALMMLVGSYEAAQAQSQMVTEEQAAARETAARETGRQMAETEEATEKEEATKEFLGLKWGLGIGVMGSFEGDDPVEKASIGSDNVVRVDEEGDFRPQMFLEMHAFLRGSTVKEWRRYQRWKAGDQMAAANKMKTLRTEQVKMPDPPLWGFGPFVAIQGGDDDVINALAVGMMWGIRKSPDATNSVNIGVGLSFDPSVQVLAKGFKEGATPPAGEEEVRFKKEGRFGWSLMASFTF